VKATARVMVYISGAEDQYESSVKTSVELDLGDVQTADFATLVARDLPQRLRDLSVAQRATPSNGSGT